MILQKQTAGGAILHAGPSTRSPRRGLVISHLFEQGWAFSASTRRVPTEIPTVPGSTGRVQTLIPPVAAVAMVVNERAGDGQRRC
jgi:hypothetical protein